MGILQSQVQKCGHTCKVWWEKVIKDWNLCSEDYKPVICPYTGKSKRASNYFVFWALDRQLHRCPETSTEIKACSNTRKSDTWKSKKIEDPQNISANTPCLATGYGKYGPIICTWRIWVMEKFEIRLGFASPNFKFFHNPYSPSAEYEAIFSITRHQPGGICTKNDVRRFFLKT